MSRARRRWTDSDRETAQDAGRRIAAEVRARRDRVARPLPTLRDQLIAAGLLTPDAEEPQP